MQTRQSLNTAFPPLFRKLHISLKVGQIHHRLLIPRFLLLSQLDLSLTFFELLLPNFGFDISIFFSKQLTFHIEKSSFIINERKSSSKISNDIEKQNTALGDLDPSFLVNSPSFTPKLENFLCSLP